MRRPWRWAVWLGGVGLIALALHRGWSSRPTPAPAVTPAAAGICTPAVRDSLEAGLARLGGRSRAAGARGDLAALHLLSDSVDSLRRALDHRCPADSSVVAP